jgi:hypothetical protein
MIFMITSWTPSYFPGTVRASQVAVMVWDSSCLSAVAKSKDTKLIAPLNEDGTPDMKHSFVRGVHVTYDPTCGHIEIQK